MAETLPKWTAQRVIILVIVIVFFVSSFALSAIVVYEAFFKDNDTDIVNVEDLNIEEGAMLAGSPLAGFTPVTDITELEIIDQEVGTGAAVPEGGSVVAHYTGAVAQTGTVFQSSFDGAGQPVPFSLASVIEGWQKGIPGMKEGGKRRLLIPAEMAYGANPPANSGIPPNAALVFDVVLVSVE